MTAAIIITLAAIVCYLGWLLFDLSCDIAVAARNLDASQRAIDDLRAHLAASPPAKWIEWPAGQMHPNTDPVHCRVFIDGKRHYFTKEAVAVAADRDGRFPDGPD